jgi:hypothetical protein
MAWSPVRRFNAGWFEVDHPGVAILNSNQSSYGTAIWTYPHCQNTTIETDAANDHRKRHVPVYGSLEHLSKDVLKLAHVSFLRPLLSHDCAFPY